MDPPPPDQMLARRQEVKRRADTIAEFSDPKILEFKLNDRVITDSYKLLLEWLLGAALAAADRRTDRRIETLLADLRWWRRQFLKKDKPFEEGGPFITIAGKIGSLIHATGSTKQNWITITVEIPADSPEQILANPDYKEMREKIADEMAICFAHEGAHLWLLNKYKNDSHPWTRTVPEAPYASDRDPGIEFDHWPDRVKEAFNEFVGGGHNKQAAANPDLQRLVNALSAHDYFYPATWDRRGRELVSHLIELAYRWNAPHPFEEVFPLCAALLDDVLTEFEPKPTSS